MPSKKEDLGIKIGTKDEIAWTELRDSAKEQNETMMRNIKVNNVVIEFAEEQIVLEREKLK